MSVSMNTQNYNLDEIIPVWLQHLINYAESTDSSGSTADWNQ